MKREIMLAVLHATSKYPAAQVENAAFLAAELLEKGGTLSEDGTFTVATPVFDSADDKQIMEDLQKRLLEGYVPKATADGLFQYLCQLLELLDHEAWTDPNGRDVRLHPVFRNIKTVVLSNIVNNFRNDPTFGADAELQMTAGEPNRMETPIEAAARAYGPESREYFVAVSEQFLGEVAAAYNAAMAEAANAPHS